MPGESGDNQGSMPQAWNPTGFGKSGRAMSVYRTDLSWNNTGHGTDGGSPLGRVKAAVHEWLLKKSATKREILSLVGLLQHATKVVRPGRSFLSRMYSTAARVPELHYYTRLNKEFRSDLAWWHLFLEDWNGTSFLQLASYPHVL